MVPWALKDPRLCLTLPFWMPLLSVLSARSSSSSSSVAAPLVLTPPAVLFTFRHPVEVAKSLQKREAGFTLKRGLLLWLAYNQQALAGSSKLPASLAAAATTTTTTTTTAVAAASSSPSPSLPLPLPCRVVTSNARLTAAPLAEMQRIADDLRGRCGLALPKRPSAADVAAFVDPSLQRNHATSSYLSSSSSSASSSSSPSPPPPPPPPPPAGAAGAGAGAAQEDCDPEASWESFGLVNNLQTADAPVTEQQRRALRMALAAFCDMHLGRAFTSAEFPGGQLAPGQAETFRHFYDAPLEW